MKIIKKLKIFITFNIDNRNSTIAILILMSSHSMFNNYNFFSVIYY